MTMSKPAEKKIMTRLWLPVGSKIRFQIRVWFKLLYSTFQKSSILHIFMYSIFENMDSIFENMYSIFENMYSIFENLYSFDM